ncbi:hypothetical protein [Streptomyces marianii]|uniref:Uncharacterized protein n=1 Tax=Streptomyces marianii TaxID=1817406 RepID=A0A5R9DS14_9ACTN|nr:hypothetical protein [Streptomyces marianii]TLQ38734.1 hypothetical protein FEF34_40535 [Streptomyces marianii]
MNRTPWKRCGHGPGAMHPGDQAVVDAFRTLLAARKQPGPWQPGDDVAIEIGGHVARARTAPSHQPDTVGLVVVDPADGTPLIGGITADRTRILGTWSAAYAPLSHTAAGKPVPHPTMDPAVFQTLARPAASPARRET